MFFLLIYANINHARSNTVSHIITYMYGDMYGLVSVMSVSHTGSDLIPP